MSKNLKDIIATHIYHALRLKRLLIDHHVKDSGLTRNQWRGMLWATLIGAPCSQKELLANMDVDCAQMTRLLEQLEQKELVTRQPIQGNRRAMEVHLTPKGIELTKELRKVVEYEEDIITRGFSAKEKKQLKELLIRVQGNLITALANGETYD